MSCAYELSAGIEWLFAENDRPFADRIRVAAAEGIAAVEFWPWPGKDLGAIAAACAETGTEVTSFVADTGVRLVDEATHNGFLRRLPAACRTANRLAAPYLVITAGAELPGVERERQHDAVVAGLKAAAPIAADHGVQLILEPLNTRVDHAGHFLHATAHGLDIVREVGHQGAALLYDLYHSVVMGERPAEVLSGAMDLVAHVQIADAPGRHEPGTGNIDWATEIAALHRLGYRGRLGLEYLPSATSGASLTALRHALGG
ncbi:TIM barrel protein [Streptomyces boninensis]|uniref:TIM barrel protein n=1 Tax=Streptomyces boninensis TaxID=2039455 RepID=UPI003B215F36